MVEKWYYELENKFNGVKCLDMIVMPNHFHCIIKKENANSSLIKIFQLFKTMTTNEYIRGVKQLEWPHFDEKCGNEVIGIISYVIKKPMKTHLSIFFTIR